MIRRSLLTLLWLGFMGYSVGLAPPDQPHTLELIQQLSTGQWAEINPLIVALFNLMGIWPMMYACLALVDGQTQRVPAWPFVLGSFAFGAFLLLPYLILREPNSKAFSLKSWGLILLESRWLGVGLLTVSAGLLGYGVYAGHWQDFWAQWQTSRFIHVMSLDFCVLWALVPSLLGDGMARRGLKKPVRFWLVSLIPLVGIGAYLASRPGLLETGLSQEP